MSPIAPERSYEQREIDPSTSDAESDEAGEPAEIEHEIHLAETDEQLCSVIVDLVKVGAALQEPVVLIVTERRYRAVRERLLADRVDVDGARVRRMLVIS